MKPIYTRRLIGLMLVFILCLLGCSTSFQNFASFPQKVRMFSGQDKLLKLNMPVNAQVSVEDLKIIHVNGSSEALTKISLKQPITLQTGQIGSTKMTLKLFGKIPFKTVKVNVMPDLNIIPGGQTIGVKMKSAGVLVVGNHLVTVGEQQKISPGEIAKVQMGDLIVSINGIPITDVNQMADWVTKSGETKIPLELTIKRNDEQLKIKLQPAYDVLDKSYRLGLYIRDSAAGVGTLTFYAPDQNVYGALGHVITDMDTQTPIVVGGGEIVHSNVTSIAKSLTGEPGEKRANFTKNSRVLGNIEKNTAFGIFGKMASIPENGLMNEAIPVAYAEDVKEGPAQILTVVNGQKVEKFDIEITHISRQEYPSTKGLVIKITDPKLLEKTGGIVQGMSGSPIIQNGKIIGAVTHVFVNDPTSGYGCFIEWMLQDAGILQKERARIKGELESPLVLF